MPVFRRIRSLIECPFSATWSIEKDTIESLRGRAKILSRIECDSYIRTSHAVEILQKLGDSLTSWLIGYDK